MPGQLEIFEEFDHVKLATDAMALAESEERGAIFTRKVVVEFILDLSGYESRKKLYRKRILEPSFGHGEFLEAILERLLTSFRRDFGEGPYEDVGPLFDAVRGVELHRGSCDEVRTKLSKKLREAGFSKEQVGSLLSRWLMQGDYLFARFDVDGFDFVVGNPPYLRQEMIPDPLLVAYRERFSTMYDRADLYIAFYERSLELLNEEGRLGFICADRWVKNKYGGPLREMVSHGFHLDYFVPMSDADAFHEEVSAYPAVTIISRPKEAKANGETRIGKLEGGLSQLKKLATKLRAKKLNGSVEAMDLARLGRAPWILTGDAKTRLVRNLEARFPLIEEAGCTIRIGVATGADKVYIGKFDELDVEPERKLKLAKTRDFKGGKLVWQGNGIVNPFNEDGSLALLEDFPKMAAHFELHLEKVKGRNVAKRNGQGWYRTIDRIYPSLAQRPKLLIPDIRGHADVVYENQGLYPHHNLYYVVSDEWDLHALQGVLISGLARMFVSTYATLMRGGYLRFQAQYLRRIRIPKWEDIGKAERKSLIAAAKGGDGGACNEIIARILDLNSKEKVALEQLLK